MEEVASGGVVEIGEAGAGGGEQRGERSHGDRHDSGLATELTPG
nr:hypothetical protein [Streptomyces europaeiscabiei]